MMTVASDSERCRYVFDIEEWQQTHDGECYLDPDDDAEILTERDTSPVWKCPHRPVDGTDRCVFHPSPDEDSASGDAAAKFRTIVNGEKLATGEGTQSRPQFIGARFEGLNLDCDALGDEAPIDLRHARVDRLQWDINTVGSPIDARGITIEYQGIFDGATFEGEADFRGATFEGRAGFDGTTFEGRAGFDGTTFEGRAGFDGAMFWDEAGFYGTTFESVARFRRTTFEGEAGFYGATFEGVSHFRDAKFGGVARFRRATFEGEAGFYGATFESVARFRRATFEGEAGFNDVVFLGGEASFSEANFVEDASFTLNISRLMNPSHIFAQSTSFAHATVRGTLDLRIVNTDEKVIGEELATFGGGVDFTDATIRNARFDGVSFETQHVPGDDGLDVTFADADLTDASIRIADFTGVDLSDADLTNTICRGVEFTDANLEGAIFSRANLYEAGFTNARLYGTLFSDARISDETTFIDSGSWWTWVPGVTKGMQTVLDDPRTDPTSDSVADAEEMIDPRSRAASIYAQLETLARNNARTQLGSKCFRWRKDMERKRYWSNDGAGTERQRARAVFATLTNAFTRYGDSPWRVVGWSGAVILASTILLQVATKGIQTCPTCEAVKELSQLLYFSVVTFTTLGYGDYQPAGAWAQWIASVESLVGALLVALLVAVLGRRATR